MWCAYCCNWHSLLYCVILKGIGCCFTLFADRLHIIGVHLDCESRVWLENMEIKWHKLVNKVKSILGRGEAVALLGDFKRAIDNPKETHGKMLSIKWLEDDMLTLLNGNI